MSCKCFYRTPWLFSPETQFITDNFEEAEEVNKIISYCSHSSAFPNYSSHDLKVMLSPTT
jgi:hypothetical protein